MFSFTLITRRTIVEKNDRQTSQKRSIIFLISSKFISSQHKTVICVGILFFRFFLNFLLFSSKNQNDSKIAIKYYTKTKLKDISLACFQQRCGGKVILSPRSSLKIPVKVSRPKRYPLSGPQWTRSSSPR